MFDLFAEVMAILKTIIEWIRFIWHSRFKKLIIALISILLIILATISTGQEKLVHPDITSAPDPTPPLVITPSPKPTPKPLVNLKVSIQEKNGHLQISWNKINNQTVYKIYVSSLAFKEKSLDDYVFRAETKGNSYQDKKVSSRGYWYYYKIIAYDQQGEKIGEGNSSFLWPQKN